MPKGKKTLVNRREVASWDFNSGYPSGHDNCCICGKRIKFQVRGYYRVEKKVPFNNQYGYVLHRDFAHRLCRYAEE